jgi:hypothetical protein
MLIKVPLLDNVGVDILEGAIVVDLRFVITAGQLDGSQTVLLLTDLRVVSEHNERLCVCFGDRTVGSSRVTIGGALASLKIGDLKSRFLCIGHQILLEQVGISLQCLADFELLSDLHHLVGLSS